jgi:hypothetical protein
MTTELAWSWLRFQPDGALSVWFRERFGSGGQALATDWDCGRGPQVTHGALALSRDRGDTRGSGAQSGVSAWLMRRHASVWVLVEATRGNSGPAKHAVV